MNKYNIPNILRSTADKLKSGKITMRQAQERLYKAGWFNYVPSEAQVLKLLEKYI
jgi:hypothetical protein